MKIGMIVNNMDVSGGYQKLVLRLSEQLVAKGHVVIVYTLSANKHNCYPDLFEKVNIVSLVGKRESSTIFTTSPLQKIKERVFPFRSTVKQFKNLSKLMCRDFQSIIIHDWQSIYGISFYKSCVKNLKILWMLNNEMPENFGSLTFKVLQLLRGGRHVKRLILNLCTLPALLIENLALKRGLKKIDIFATYDAFNKTQVEKRLKRIAKVVYAGADVDDFKKIYKVRTYPQKSTYNVLSVGVMFPHRRYEDTINAIALLNNNDEYSVTALIVGLQTFCPEYARELFLLRDELQLEDKVIFKEYVSDEEMHALYENSDAFVFVNDGLSWGISVFEAVAAGLPVVITNNIGAADLIENGKQGWVVKARCPSQVAQSIMKIITDKNLAEERARNAYHHITSIVSWNSYAQRIIDLLE